MLLNSSCKFTLKPVCDFYSILFKLSLARHENRKLQVSFFVKQVQSFMNSFQKCCKFFIFAWKSVCDFPFVTQVQSFMNSVPKWLITQVQSFMNSVSKWLITQVQSFMNSVSKWLIFCKKKQRQILNAMKTKYEILMLRYFLKFPANHVRYENIVSSLMYILAWDWIYRIKETTFNSG